MPEIEVHDRPRGEERHRDGKGGGKYKPTATALAQHWIAEAWRTSGFGRVGTEAGGWAVRVDVTALLARPRGHYGSGRNALALRPTAPRWPTSRTSFDRDNLDKLVLDALSGLAFVDDSFVVDGRVRKTFCRDGETPGWRIGVFNMEECGSGDEDHERPGAACEADRSPAPAGATDG